MCFAEAVVVVAAAIAVRTLKACSAVKRVAQNCLCSQQIPLVYFDVPGSQNCLAGFALFAVALDDQNYFVFQIQCDYFAVAKIDQKELLPLRTPLCCVAAKVIGRNLACFSAAVRTPPACSAAAD